MHGAAYEFSPEEEARIAKLAWRVRAWGVIALVFGIVGIAGVAIVWLVLSAAGLGAAELLVSASVVMAPAVVVNAIIALLYIGAGGALRRVVSTRGEDVPHLLDGLERLGGAFRIETILGSIGVIVAAMALYAVIGELLR